MPTTTRWWSYLNNFVKAGLNIATPLTGNYSHTVSVEWDWHWQARDRWQERPASKVFVILRRDGMDKGVCAKWQDFQGACAFPADSCLCCRNEQRSGEWQPNVRRAKGKPPERHRHPINSRPIRRWGLTLRVPTRMRVSFHPIFRSGKGQSFPRFRSYMFQLLVLTYHCTDTCSLDKSIAYFWEQTRCVLKHRACRY